MPRGHLLRFQDDGVRPGRQLRPASGVLGAGVELAARTTSHGELADALVAELELEGEIQVASFHPDYQFAGTAPDDVSNCTNRAPYPTLHLLREASIDRAVEAYPDPEVIVERNIATLEQLGWDGWRKLLAD